MRYGLWLMLCASVAPALACDDGERVVSADDSTFRGLVINTPVLNSAAMNGVNFNGFHLNGVNFNGFQLNGFQLNSDVFGAGALQGVALEGSLFSGTFVSDGVGVPVGGLDFVGAQIELTNGDQVYTLRIDDITLTDAPGGDVYLYDVKLSAGGGPWSSLCTDGNGQPEGAVPLQNLWNTTTGARIDAPTAVTFACRSAVLAKCALWGYRPWATTTECDGQGLNCAQVSMRDHHQACTRMARADYCGDGTPHTFTGTPIDIFDHLGQSVQSPTTIGMKDWYYDAEWGPDGAVCVGPKLRTKMYTDLKMPIPPAPCLDALDFDPKRCGSFVPSTGGKLANRWCQQWIPDPSKCQVN